MKYEELRRLLQERQKYPGCVRIARAPLINPGFPGTFNLSFTEDPWLKKYGQYVDFDHDYVFSTIQSCVRPQDIPLIDTDKSSKYLGVFEIADLAGIVNLAQKPDYAVLQKKQIEDLITLFRQLGIAPDKIHPSYNTGGSVAQLTKGKYAFDFAVPLDEISKNAFLEAGVPEENLIPDATRDTLLSLHMHRPTPWGYRNEVNINIGSKESPILLDVATLEYMPWKPKFQGDTCDSKNIIGLEEQTCGVSLAGVGLERLCMAINGLKRVQDVDHIAPVYGEFKRLFGTENCVGVESLRALHRIYSDVASYGCVPGRHQKSKIRDLLRNVPEQIEPDQINALLTIHTETQPWHHNLQEGIEPTMQRIEAYRK